MGRLGADVDGMGAQRQSRGLIASWPQFGVPGGLFLANLAVLAFSADLGRAVPGLGLAHPVLSEHRAGRRRSLHPARHPGDADLRAGCSPNSKIERTPMLEVIMRSTRRRSCCRPLRAWPSRRRSTSSPPSSSPTAPARCSVSRDLLLTAVLAASGAVVRHRSRVRAICRIASGRKRMYMIGAAADRRVRLRLFRAARHRHPTSMIFLAIVLSLIPHDMMYGPQAALIAECFTGRLRYSGASLGYQLASVIAGRAGAADRDLAVRDLQFGQRHRRLHRGLRRDHPDRHASDDGLHRQGHFGRVQGALTAGLRFA